MKRLWFHALLLRRVFVIVLLLLQAATLVYLITVDNLVSNIVRIALQIISYAVVLFVISRKDKGDNKVGWVFLILLFPVFGGLFYLLCLLQGRTKHLSQRVETITEQIKPFYQLPGTAFQMVESLAPEHLPQIRYLQSYAGFPVYDGTQCAYFSPGEAFFPVLIKELVQAEHYIFLEYFIISEGRMWNEILNILRSKVKQGVEVRVIYDDIGCFLTLPKDYAALLREDGIQCAVFNPFRPVLSAVQNNRDHRKILTIDGKTAFTGGINLADEYINEYEKYGYWKDSALMVKGKAAWSLTLIFLEMWALCQKDSLVGDLCRFYPSEQTAEGRGLVQPYADSPMDDENVSEHVYLQILNNAKRYVYITTPYLIVDTSLVSALCLAAKSGVDVRIITPHIWDKALVHMTTRSYYRDLIRSGIRIFEFTDGFIHSKTFVSDDHTATVGTPNLDFRSLYLHFECGVWMYDTDAVLEVKEDFLATQELSQEITLSDCHVTPIKRLFQSILRIFSPLM